MDRRYAGVVRQQGEETCGYAAVATVLGALGWDATEEAVMERAGAQKSGPASLAGVRRAFESYGLRAHALSSTPDQLATYLTRHGYPAVVLLAGASPHFSVVARVVEGSWVLVDPARGHVVMPARAFSAAWTGATVLVEPAGRPLRHPGSLDGALLDQIERTEERHAGLLRLQLRAWGWR